MTSMNVSSSPDRRVKNVAMQRLDGPFKSDNEDCLAAEEPLEIRVHGHSIAVVMRTPGDDHELAAGFLVTEGLVHSGHDIVSIKSQSHCFSSLKVGSQHREINGSPNGFDSGSETDHAGGNVVNMELRDPERLDLKSLTRHVFSSSSCGVCSKASIEAVRQQFPPIADDF